MQAISFTLRFFPSSLPERALLVHGIQHRQLCPSRGTKPSTCSLDSRALAMSVVIILYLLCNLFYFAAASTVLFHSIRHPAWRVTSLPKFRFRQAPYLNVTFKYFRQVGCKFCARRLKIVHFQLNYINYLHNAHKRDRRGSGIFFYFKFIFSNFRMISALHENLRYLRYISAILSAAWRVTAELNEIVQ